MKISISNLAWDLHEEKEIINILRDYKVRGIEIAPTKVWGNPTDCSPQQADQYKCYWLEKNIIIVAMQSLLFGQNSLHLFREENSRQKMKNYLFRIIELAGELGVKSLVFGSPKNRLIGDLTKVEQYNIAIPFFHAVGEYAIENNVQFCIEPNPVHYGCEFVTNSSEGLELVQEVGSKGFRLHLDAAGMFLAEEDISNALEKSFPYLAHFHVSEPYLELIGSSQVQHHLYSRILKSLGYNNWVSIEMKNGLKQSNAESVKRALQFVSEIY
ncbi:sugar phosphate isomerase/epimerase [Paenibacillus thiaminolyticus]|uniref:Sugar phosphate isomerase/epimerase n=1 Tax=Paenibacillus thiaminolyticus TaxID=49283 RepID=A0A3A3GNY9_PANTH|nr:sugar phosphate isomerase/epimerase family protein [Paenibacillus thiaminolyticus]RJG24767.1 sugar phosphate isomerase/epimerase [Paenibacillus thiaminolyticus]